MDGVLFCNFSRKDGTGGHIYLIVPRKLKDEIMYQMHESLLSGTFGQMQNKGMSYLAFLLVWGERGL